MSTLSAQCDILFELAELSKAPELQSLVRLLKLGF